MQVKTTFVCYSLMLFFLRVNPTIHHRLPSTHQQAANQMSCINISTILLTNQPYSPCIHSPLHYCHPTSSKLHPVITTLFNITMYPFTTSLLSSHIIQTSSRYHYYIQHYPNYIPLSFLTDIFLLNYCDLFSVFFNIFFS